ncbi:Peptide hydrolase [Mycena kentingensis (nom. inval.)]|nr:Peptide hydrolase [Mycena kentingensis (nom. inval.)]
MSSVWRSLLALAPVLVLAPWLAIRHTQGAHLAKPQSALLDGRTGMPQISEPKILAVARHLSEDIGFRTVGTHEHALADAWMLQQAEAAKRHCDQVARIGNRALQCEVWHQRGSGTHRFDMMGKRLYKTYQNLTNIVIRISNGSPHGKEHALLLNSHLDSTLPSPGAADDAISVGVMLECMRVLVNTPRWSPAHAIILLFNHAEESLQDGSHLFSTQHEIAHTVRAVINLEAAGTTGRDLLFQATSEEMVEAYSKVPRPFGTVFANDIFNSGVLLSDTDFRQFEEYLDVPGLDIAIVGNSYLYHMRKDLVENIQPGVAQNMGENTLALIEHLTAPGSPLPSLYDVGSSKHNGVGMHLVYFGFLSWFFMYRFSTAKVLYGALLAAVVFWTRDDLRKHKLRAVLAGLGGTVLLPNIVAVFMANGLGKGMSWFAGGPWAALTLYAPMALLGALTSLYLLPTKHISERGTLTTIIFLQSVLAFAIQLLNVGSAAIFFITGAPMFAALVVNDVLFAGASRRVSLWFYALGGFVPLLGGTLITLPTLDVFVPLTGRLGPVPADTIVATLVSILGALALPLTVPFAHRHHVSLPGMLAAVGAVVLAVVAVFMRRDVFDEMHQKRVFVVHIENVTTSEYHLHVATADGAPGFPALVQDIAALVAGDQAVAETVAMNDYNGDWDPLYPFSAFLSPYKIAIPAPAGYMSPWASAFTLSTENDVTDLQAGTRSFTLVVNHPGLIWTVIAFDAHVLKWNLDDSPPAEYARHHVKEASFYGATRWTLDLVVKLSPAEDRNKILVNFIGLQESAMWPGKKAGYLARGEGGPAMKLFERLDGWLGETVDATLLGCVGGIVAI